MKSRFIQLLTILLSGFLWPHVSHGQTPAGKAYTLYYEYINLGMRERHEMTLTIQGAESLTVIQNGVSLDPETVEKDFSVSGVDPVGKQVYKNSRTGETVFRDFYSIGGAFEPCIVNDPLSPMAWKFSSETRKIGPYTCLRAQTVFRGRAYVAWYTEDLPITHGPWKFSGLPGALIEVESTDHVILFRMISVQTNAGKPVRRPTDGRVLTMKEYVKRKESSTEDLINAIKAKLPRGAEVTVNTAGDYNLETNFDSTEK